MLHLDWYRTFFSGVVVESWVKMVSPERTVQEVNFLASRLDLRAGMRLLDVPSGHGRHALLFAERGIRTTATDISNEFTDLLRGRAAAAGLEVSTFLGDMHATLPDGPFDAAVTLGNALGYADEGGVRRFLALLAERVVPDGRFAFDSGAIAESLLPNLKPALAFEIDGLRMRFENNYNTRRSRLETRCTFEKDGVTTERGFIHHVFTFREIEAMLERAGFAIDGAYGSLAGDDFRFGDPYAIVTCTRR